ncbi:TraR/DksA family transcriptional regulator [Pseudomonas aeruginosa]|uniref:TraR/DksA family transcriptional regulator n=1 Tax=Pseudomonas aeruginosa TaxID=287 RepID=UPI003F5CE62D
MAPLEIRHRSVRPISAKHAQASRFLQQSRHEGDYGWCNQCGELIASGRLEFDPATPLCITCASRAESG